MNKGHMALKPSDVNDALGTLLPFIMTVPMCIVRVGTCNMILPKLANLSTGQ